SARVLPCHWFVPVRKSSGTGDEGFVGDYELFAQARQAGANGGAVERGAIALSLVAGGKVPGQFVEAGAADSQRGLLCPGFDARPVEFNESADIIQRDHQPYGRAGGTKFGRWASVEGKANSGCDAFGF